MTSQKKGKKNKNNPLEATFSPEILPPQDLQAERYLLASIFVDPSSIIKVIDYIRPEDFYSLAHRLIYSSCLSLFEKDEPIDIITVYNELEKRGDLERAGGASYLSEIAGLLPTSAHISHYAKIVKEKGILREIIRISQDLIYRAYYSGEDSQEILNYAEKELFEISYYGKKESFVPLKEVIKENIKYLESLYQRGETITGIPTGFPDLDKMTAGFQRGDLIILAGRPGMGKTALALDIVRNACKLSKIGAAIFSLEMSKEQLSARLLCAEAKVNFQKFRTGNLETYEWQKIIQAANTLSQFPIYIDDTLGVNILEVKAKARKLLKEIPLGLVVIDYLQLMRSLEKKERREQEISEISAGLKAIAKELNVPVLALSQLNRKVEERPDKRPQLSDLRESGALEQDADVILFIYRDEFYNKESPEKGIAEIIIGKQRNGPTGKLKLAFLSQYSSFESLETSL
ncbi:MAG: replicative DNA helicase [Thermodesulfobacteriaceae bacterium]|nr:replicative DNA helicase [Thermodesulfobacteriaceae bacterium]MCX8042309.1 replicative DNA helicase [Thermodesulfobacteriaceae bacterium]MDW8135607.1 replicative DNA helicase [Thermodesulfobacterium sp.]